MKLTFAKVFEIMEDGNNLQYHPQMNQIYDHLLTQDPSANTAFDGVSIDSRLIEKGQIFVAMKGQLHDGANFGANAMKIAGSFMITETLMNDLSFNRQLLVKSTYKALKLLGLYASDKLKDNKVHKIGITGSAGKTTTKMLLAHLLRALGKNVFASVRNFNTASLGVPISLLNCPDNVFAAIFEAGMSESGQIESISRMINPEIGVVTAIHPAHMMNFDTLEDIAYAKAEIFVHTTDLALGIAGKFEEIFEDASEAKELRFFDSTVADTSNADYRLLENTWTANAWHCKAMIKDKQIEFKLQDTNKAKINSVLICLAIIDYLFPDDPAILNKAIASLDSFENQSGRGQMQEFRAFGKKMIVIDESYNANPQAVLNALEAFNLIDAPYKVAVMGTMLEQGRHADKYHNQVAKVLENNPNINQAIFFREGYRKIAEAKNLPYTKDLLQLFDLLAAGLAEYPEGTAILVKGSHKCNLNKLVEYLLDFHTV